MQLPDFFQFSLPTSVQYGIGLVRRLGETCAHLGPQRVFLVTDAILEQVGVVKRLEEGLKTSALQEVGRFSDVPPNSTLETVTRCAALIQETSATMIIGLGGGSVMDTAKVANLLACKGGALQDHMGAYLLDPEEKLLPMILIPTTSGTGSEVTKVAVIADLENQVKLPFAEEQFLPQLALLDPELTASMPPKLTAMTGMDALTHAIEAYVDLEWSPASDALALHAIRLISDALLRACACPEDLQARGAMQIGSCLAGVAFSHSMVGMVHGIAHALGGVYHIPHGLANALVLPEVMAYNLEERQERYADIGRALGLDFPNWVAQSQSVIQGGSLVGGLVDKMRRLSPWLDVKGFQVKHAAGETLNALAFVDRWMQEKLAQAAVAHIHTLNRQLAYVTQMPLNLEEAGIQDGFQKLDEVVEKAMEDGSMLYNPVEPRRSAIREILQRLYRQSPKPLPVPDTLRDHRGSKTSITGPTQVFSSTKMLYEVLGGFYQHLKEHPTMGPQLKATGLCIQFVYQHPSAVITIDSRGETLDVFHGDCDRVPEVTMKMDADFAHLFWHGKANLVTALTRRQVVAKGNVPKTLKLLPILKPAYDLYPEYLKGIGLEHQII
jgi:alcohol dehydrogenase class IV